ncbi:MAG: ATP-binding cassette domain-containing protein [Christensenellales bacterium]|jgi:ABC-type sugar transport system ATPase subunit
MIELLNVSFNYFGYPPSINNINLTVSRGEKIAVFSESRGGKTTLMLLLAGLLKPVNGVITVGGKDISRIKLRERDTAMVFESLALPSYRTGKGILMRPFRLRGAGLKQAREAARESAEKYDITPLWDFVPKLMNNYDKVRLAIARAFMRSPRTLIIDNPLKLMNITDRRNYFNELINYIRELEGTVIYATDDIEETKFFNRVIIIRNGYIVEEGNYLNFTENPVNLYTLKRVYYDKLNLIKRVVNENAIALYGKSVNVDAEDGTEIIAAIPADGVILSGKGESVTDIRERGDGYCTVNAGDGRLTVKGSGDRIQVDEKSVMLFDLISEKRL